MTLKPRLDPPASSFKVFGVRAEVELTVILLLQSPECWVSGLPQNVLCLTLLFSVLRMDLESNLLHLLLQYIPHIPVTTSLWDACIDTRF